MTSAAFATPATLLEALQPGSPDFTNRFDLVSGGLKVAGITEEDLMPPAEPKPDPQTLHAKLREILIGLDSGQWSTLRATALEIQARAFAPSPPLPSRVRAMTFQEPVPVAALDHPLWGIVEKDIKRGKFKLRLELKFGQLKNGIGTLNDAGNRLVVSTTKSGEASDVYKALKRFLKTKLNLAKTGQIILVTRGRDNPNHISIIIQDRPLLQILDTLNLLGPGLAFKPEIERLVLAAGEKRGQLTEWEARLRKYELAGADLLSDPERGELEGTLMAMRGALAKAEALSGRPDDKLSSERVRLEARDTLANLEEARREFEEAERQYLEHRHILFKKIRPQIEAALEAVTEMRRHYLIVYRRFKRMKEKIDALSRPPEGWEAIREQKKGLYAILKGVKATRVDILAQWGEAKEALPKEILLALEKMAQDILGNGPPFVEAVAQLERRLVLLDASEEARDEAPLAPVEAASSGEEWRQVVLLYDELRKLLAPASRGALSIPNKILADATSALGEIDRLAEAAFGTNISYWPPSVASAYRELKETTTKIREQLGQVREYAKECEQDIRAGSHPNKIRRAAVLGLMGIRNLQGQIAPSLEAFIFPTRGKKLLIESWRDAYGRALERIRIEKEKPFEIKPADLQTLENFQKEKLGGYETEFGYIKGQVRSEMRLVPDERLTDQLIDVAQTILGNLWEEDPKIGHVEKGMEAIARFRKSFELFQKEMGRGDFDPRELKRRFLELRRLSKVIRYHIFSAKKELDGTTVSGEKYPLNLVDLARQAMEEKVPKTFAIPDRRYTLSGHEIAVEKGEVSIDGIKLTGINLNATPRNQDRKLAQIVHTLDIPEQESKESPELAHPPFREKVERLLKEEKPLRRLVDVDDTLGIALVFDERFQTVFYIPYKEGWMLQGARAIVPMFHGGGGSRSTGRTMIAPAIKFRNDFKYNAITFDTPNHGHAIKDRRFHDLAEFQAWTGTLLNYFKFLSGGVIPVVPIGRSHGDNNLDEYASRQGRVLLGFVGISGYDPAWNEPTLPTLLRRIEEGDFKPHPQGLPMVFAHEGVGVTVVEGGKLVFGEKSADQWTFLNPAQDEVRGRTPTLLLQGTADAEYSEGRPEFWKEREERAKRLGFDFLTVDGGPHDLLSLNNPPEMIDLVYRKISAFIEGIIARFIAVQKSPEARLLDAVFRPS